MEDQGIQLPVAQVPASEAKPGTPPVIYPTVEEMTFRGIIASEQEGYALLRAVQMLVNGLGAATIIQVMAAVEKKPQLMEKAKSFLPYINLL
ncbi:MAG: hypothetical protein ACOH2V_00775 [Candidatus Saccharimonadaceae bacterium]